MIDLLQVLSWGPAVFSVGEVTDHVKALLDDDPTLTDCWVRGEICDARTYASGHTYFTLRDGSSQLKCVLFRQRARGLDKLENGRQYMVRGAISVYEASGVYQLYVTQHRPVGVGDLFTQFERLKAQLETEGLFAPERKRPLPRWPRRIGIATSASGAVLHDLRNVIGRRYPVAELVLAPCQVQGADAVRTVVASLRALDRAEVDVIVVARGGGSMEDLWAFNEEPVARAIAACATPVVSAIGHETDFTIADFVADLRAPTPSAAAELLVPDRLALQREIASLVERADRAVKAQLWVAATDLADAEARMRRSVADRLRRDESRLAGLTGRLAALSPRAVLERGYSLMRLPDDGPIVRSTTQIQAGQRVEIVLTDGTLEATVEAVTPTSPTSPTGSTGSTGLTNPATSATLVTKGHP